MKVIDKKMLFVNSKEREPGGTISDFTISVPPHLLTRNKNQQMRLIINDLNIPYTWYNVQSSNNVFKVYELNDEGASLFYNISLDLGSYHVLQLRDHLKKKLNDNSISQGASYIYTVVYNELSAMFTFSSYKASMINATSFGFEFDHPSAAQLLGFEPSAFYPTLDGVQSLVSVKAVNMMYTDALYLHCDLPTTNIHKGSGDKTVYSLSSVFAKINVNTVPFSNIIYQNVNDDFITNIPDRFINKLRFSVQTLEHNPIDLNDDFSLTLKLEIIEDDERVIVNQNKSIAELLRTLLLQQHVKKIG